jgi:hypothetical protein
VWALVQGADCPWNRGSIATWLGDDVRVDQARLAPPYALEASAAGARPRRCGASSGSPFERGLALARSGERSDLTEAVGVFDALGAEAAPPGRGRCSGPAAGPRPGAARPARGGTRPG